MLGAAASSGCTRQDVHRAKAGGDPRTEQTTPIPPSESSQEAPSSTSYPAPVEPLPEPDSQMPVNDDEIEGVLDDLDQALQDLEVFLGANTGFDVAIP